ncbi:MAG TPA: ATP-binding protein [Caulobacter sp.]|nr:ATP-binding protein [Caulobacter sp.]
MQAPPVSDLDRTRPAAPIEDDGVLPTLDVSQILLKGLIAPLPLLWLLTLPFGLAFALLGHPWIGLASCLSNMAGDAVAQRQYRRWQAQSDAGEDPAGLESRIGAVVAARAGVAFLWPVLAVLLRGSTIDFAYLGLTAAMLLSIGVAQGSLSTRLYWMSSAPILTGLTVAVLARFPPQAAAGLLLGIFMLAMMLAMMSGGVSRILGDWTQMRERNTRLIERLRAERAEAEAAREAARSAARAKSSFLATMSHEIRTPMNGVLGMAQLLKASARGEQKAQVDTLIQSGEFLMSILNDILDISRIDAGRMSIVAAPQDLRALAEEMVRFWRPTAERKGLSLRLELADDLPAQVMLDGRRVRQVLFNLIGNALKFTPAGGVALRLAGEVQPCGRLRLTFSVRDTGVGIDPAVLPTLFESFTQADESSERAFGGAGLGLSICRQLTELMDGRLWADSAPGAGSTFHLELLAPLAETAPANDRVTPATVDGAPAGLDILAVDDNPVNLLVLEQVLTAFGHRVARANGGAEALDQLALSPVDLVLMDIQMPGMTGIEALDRLRATPGPNRSVPVLAVTADVLSHDRAGLRDLGFAGQVTKPIQIPALLSEVAEAVAPRKGRAGEAAPRRVGEVGLNV